MERVDASPLMFPITPNDGVVYDPPLKGLRVGGAGDVRVQSGRNTVDIVSVQIGEHVPGEISTVYATGTTATDIIGWAWR